MSGLLSVVVLRRQTQEASAICRRGPRPPVTHLTCMFKNIPETVAGHVRGLTCGMHFSHSPHPQFNGQQERDERTSPRSPRQGISVTCCKHSSTVNLNVHDVPCECMIIRWEIFGDHGHFLVLCPLPTRPLPLTL